jgi:hypothetical protein
MTMTPLRPLWFRDDVEEVARRVGVRPGWGVVLPLTCHAPAGVHISVQRDAPDYPGLVVMHVLCAQCQTQLADIAVEEPVESLRRCGHRAPFYVGYIRRQVYLSCDACDQGAFRATVARRQAHPQRREGRSSL